MKEEKKARLAHVLLQDLPGRCAGAGAGGGELHAQTGDARGELTDPPPFRRRALGDLAGVSCKELNPYSNGSLRSYIRASHQIRTSESRENENRNAMQSCEASSRKIAHSKI